MRCARIQSCYSSPIQKTYYENGKLKEKGRLKMGTRLSYVGNNNIARCGTMGFFRQGKWNEYSSEGANIGVVIYDRGKVIKTIK
jgi:antitoxin component YwqK of YwqJK toxin-antitoxin module